MNSTSSHNPGDKFPLNSGPNALNNKTLYVTLAVSTGVALLFTLLLYTSRSGRNPVQKLPYGIFVSVLPALCALVVVKFTTLFESWRGVATVYLLLFFLILIVQAFWSMIAVSGSLILSQ